MPNTVARLIRYFVERYPGAGRTRIVKFLYMADHEARRYLGRPLTDLRYRWDHHGPFDAEIQRQLNSLGFNGYIKEEKHEREYVWYNYFATDIALPCPLKKEELTIVEHVIQSYTSLKLDVLLEEIVYQTRPMLEATTRGELLDMDLVNNEARVPGLELERMIGAFEELASGGGTPFEDVFCGA